MEGEGAGNEKLLRGTAVVLAVTAAGFAADVAKDMAIAGLFGATALADAFFVSYTIPFAIITAFLSGGRSVLVPAFADKLFHGGRRDLWGLARPLTFLGASALGVLALLGLLLSPWLIRVTGVGLSSDAQSAAVYMCRTMFLALVPAAAIVVLGSALMALGRFAEPSAVNLFRALGILLCLAVFARTFGIFAAAMGLVVGLTGECLLLAWRSWQMGFRFRQYPSVGGDQQRRIAGLLLWPTLSAFLLQNSRIVERSLATLLDPGSAAAISYAYRIVFSVTTLAVSSIVFVLLPTLSAHSAAGDRGALTDRTEFGLEMVALFVVPVSILFAIFDRSIIQVLFERGAFDQRATTLTSSALRWYALGMPWLAFLPVYNSAFYALGKVRVPVSNDLALVGINIALDIVLFRGFGLEGLALGYSLAGVLVWARMALLFRKLAGRATAQRVRAFAAHMGLSGGVMVCCALLCSFALDQCRVSFFAQALLLLAALLVSTSAFYGTLAVLRTPALCAVWSQLRAVSQRHLGVDRGVPSDER